MRLLVIDKTAVLDSAHERYERIAAHPGVDLCVLSPGRWHEHMRDVRAERTSHPDYLIRLGKTFWTGSYSRGFYLTGLGKALREFQPDVIQLLEEPWSLFAGQSVRAARKIVPQSRIYFYTWENIYRKGTYCSKLDPLHRRVEAAVLRETSGGVCATQTAESVLRRKGFAQRTQVIPYGISSAFFPDEGAIRDKSRQRLKAPPNIGYVGRLLPMKGVDTLIEALPHTRGRLSILGSGNEEQALRALANRLGVLDRIEWLPAVSPSQVPSHIAGLDILVLPSRTTSVWAEQLGRVLLEAMACGVPVIGAASGCIPEVIGEDGWIFPEGNHKALAQSIEAVTQDEPLRAQRILSAREKVHSRYTWQRFADDLLGFVLAIGQ
jgi:glycosyltransferase involved in cell wall biosynthesis